jgi:hypothetical protein
MLDYTNRFVTMPSPLSAYTYDAVKIILEAQSQQGYVNTSSIMQINYKGVTGARISKNKFYRSNQYVIMSIGKNGFVYEE